MRLLGPQPCDWRGRQLALLQAGKTLALGEAVGSENGRLTIRAPAIDAEPDSLLVRDAGRNAEGMLRTVAPIQAGPSTDEAPAAIEGAQGLRVGSVSASLVNGTLGDPLLLLRLVNQKRALLFDLGEAAALGVALIHRISDVFITHAHIDHVAGFLWLLRARIGDFPPCRLYGPPGLAGNIDAMVRGVLWDRIGDRGPVFEVSELHGAVIRRFRVQAGVRCRQLEERAAQDGTMLDEPAVRVRAAALDHGYGTTSLAYAFEPPLQLKVRKERLRTLGLVPGPWLAELKQRVLAGEGEADMELPGGQRRPCAELAKTLLLSVRGAKLGYATDFADTPGNRDRLIKLVRGAHTFFCEASFKLEDREQAAHTGHLTTRACGEVAAAAGVQRLVPFHFSRRYEGEVELAYREIEAVFGRVVRIGQAPVQQQLTS